MDGILAVNGKVSKRIGELECGGRPTPISELFATLIELPHGGKPISFFYLM
jgi:hypothetical protein